MKMFKKLAAFAAAGVLCMTALVGCGGGEGFFKGTWVPIEMTEGGETYDAAKYEEMSGQKLEDMMKFEFKDDGKVSGSYGGGDDAEGTWKLDGDNAVIEIDGESQTVKKDGDNIVIEMGDSGASVKFKKK